MKTVFACLILVSVLAVAGCDSGGGGDDTGNPSDVPGDSTPGDDTAGGDCSFAGTWTGAAPSGPFQGQTNTWTLNAGGTWHSALGSATIDGTWSASGRVLTVTDTSSVPESVACPSSQVGTYQATFTADCSGFTLAATAEPCEGRQVVLDGFDAARAP
jgi:hypothetical protein